MIKGSMVALVTPMHSNGDIDWEQLCYLVEWHVAQGTDAIVVMGTTGESATLDFEAHAQVIEAVVKNAEGRLPVIAGTGANATSEAINLTREAKAIGVDACLLVTPYYNKPTQQGLIEHYRAVADAVQIPQILYNVPSRTACDLLPEAVLALAGHPNIVAIKEATGDLARVKQILAQAPADFLVYSGDDATAMEAMFLGAQGNISVTANILPKEMAEMCRLAIEGNRASAEGLNKKLSGMNRLLFVESNPIPVKWALYRMGKIESGIRLPLTPLSEAHRGALEAELETLGLLTEACVS